MHGTGFGPPHLSGLPANKIRRLRPGNRWGRKSTAYLGAIAAAVGHMCGTGRALNILKLLGASWVLLGVSPVTNLPSLIQVMLENT